jgi:hypothetical protein
MRIISATEISKTVIRESASKILEGNHPTGLQIIQSLNNKRNFQIDCIENTIPSCDLFSQCTLVPRKIFIKKAENKQIERVKLFESLIKNNKRISSKLTNLGYPHLIIEVGELYTRAFVFDVVEDSYRLIAVGESISTVHAPNFDVWVGINNAVTHATNITGCDFSSYALKKQTDKNGRIPTKYSVPIVLSADSNINVFVLHKANTNSDTYIGKKLVAIPCNVCRKIKIENIESVIQSLNEMANSQPDLIICEEELGLERINGTGFANWVDLIRTLFVPEQIPEMIIFQSKFKPGVNGQIKTGDLDGDFENNILRVSKRRFSHFEKSTIAEIANRIQTDRIPGLHQENGHDGHSTINRLEAGARVLQFLEKDFVSTNGILSVYLGYSAASMITSKSGEVRINSYPELGSLSETQEFIKNISTNEVLFWITGDIDISYIEEYIANKSIFPYSIPATVADLEIEYAIACQILFSMVRRDSAGRGKNAGNFRNNQSYDLIFASGKIFSLSQDFVKDALILLNGVQPSGVVSMLLDRIDLIPALGASAEIDPLIPVQILETNVFENLGTFICVESETRTGTPVLKIKIKYESGKTELHEIYMGDLVNFYLDKRENAELFLQPLHRGNIGMGPGRGGVIRVRGGCLGIVVDARGRPLNLPADIPARKEKLVEWESRLERFD